MQDCKKFPLRIPEILITTIVNIVCHLALYLDLPCSLALDNVISPVKLCVPSDQLGKRINL